MGSDNQDSAKLHIKCDRINDHVFIDGKEWLPSKEWSRLTNDVMGAYVTFKSGKEFDFFMAGEYPDTVIDDNDYAEGFFDYIKSRYDEVYSISSASNPYYVIPHFEILGR